MTALGRHWARVTALAGRCWACAAALAGRLWVRLTALIVKAQDAMQRLSVPGPLLSHRQELWVYAAIAATALGTRLWDVGGRALHYDEILHAWYSWRFVDGAGYSHTPLTHGPFLFHGAAAVFSVFGASDFTVRLLPALFGAALVGMPYLLRRELGRYGALAASVFLLISPSTLYFSRFIRNDVFMAVWAVGLLVVMLRYMERPRTPLLFAWVALWALAYSTKESAYLLAGTFGLFLFILAAPALWGWAGGKQRLSAVPPSGDLFIVLGTLSLPLWAPIAGLLQGMLGIILVNADPNDPRIAAGELVRAAGETGSPIGGALYIAAFLVVVFTGVSIAIGLLWDRRRWPWLAAAFIAVWLPLFTSLFTNWQGFFTGLWGSLSYWIAQQAVERAGQPWYYYIVGLSTYEFLAAIPALAGGVYLLIWRRTLFDTAIVSWAVLTFILFTIAGEKMPWLLMGVTLPIALVAGRITGLLIERVERSEKPVTAYLSGVLLGALVPFIAVRIALADSVVRDPWFWAGAALVPLSTAVLVILSPRRLLEIWNAPAGERRPLTLSAPVMAAAVLGVLTVAGAFTAATSVRAAYSYAGFERPRELLVYSQTGQETSYAAECIARLADASGIGKESLRILVGESDSFAWQWRWYLRDYPNVTYRSFRSSPLQEPPDHHVVMMSLHVEGANRGQLASFERAGGLTHLWWFPNYTYADLTPAAIIEGAFSHEGWRTAIGYMVQRELSTAMQRTEGVVYVASEIASHAKDCTALRANSVL